MASTVRVSSIFIYPIKSCRGISVSQAPLTPTGFRWDREWLIVNQKGRAYTQRVEPKLALVQVEMPEESFLEGWEPSPNSFLAIKAPGMAMLKVSLGKPHEKIDGISVWEWSGSALDEGAEASKWFSEYLGKPSRLVRFNSASETRPVDPIYACGHRVMFADMYPFMLLSQVEYEQSSFSITLQLAITVFTLKEELFQGSVDALNNLLQESVRVNRFRPNILIDGCEPFSEDLWTEIKINNFTFHGVKLCSRCKVPSINQETGIAGKELNETLRKLRSDAVLRPAKKQQGKIYFGQNLVWKGEAGSEGKVIKVGDGVYVVKKVSSAEEAAA